MWNVIKNVNQSDFALFVVILKISLQKKIQENPLTWYSCNSSCYRAINFDTSVYKYFWSIYPQLPLFKAQVWGKMQNVRKKHDFYWIFCLQLKGG